MKFVITGSEVLEHAYTTHVINNQGGWRAMMENLAENLGTDLSAALGADLLAASVDFIEVFRTT